MRYPDGLYQQWRLYPVEDKLKKEVLSLVDEYQTISKEKQEEAVPKVSDPQIIISETFI